MEVVWEMFLYRRASCQEAGNWKVEVGRAWRLGSLPEDGLPSVSVVGLVLLRYIHFDYNVRNIRLAFCTCVDGIDFL